MLEKNKLIVKELEKDKDETVMQLRKEEDEAKRRKRLEKKRNAGITDVKQGESRMNRDIGDTRYGEKYKGDYRLDLYMREKKMAYEMSKAQFYDNPSSEDEDKAENERDMGEEMGIVDI